MTETIAIGIDLGTSTSEVCVYWNGLTQSIKDPRSKTPIVPSVVAINNHGLPVIGSDAMGYVDLDGRGIREVKRLMGTDQTITLKDKHYRPEEISALILNKLKEQAEEATGKPVREVVISVPANFNDRERNATYKAGELAGLKITRMINEPTAAIMAFCVKNMKLDGKIAVFDFGGGTLDITIADLVQGSVVVECSHGDTRLGGKDIDDLLQKFILERFKASHPQAQIPERSKNLLKQFAEGVKKSLSNAECVDNVLPNFAIDAGAPIDLELEITRAEFDALIQPLIERARKLIGETLAIKGLQPGQIDHVLLVGGTTYIPAIRRMVGQAFRQEPLIGVDPDLAVAIGAATMAASDQGLLPVEKDPNPIDVSSFGLGIDVVDYSARPPVLRYDSLMPPQTSIPYSVEREYFALPDQRQVEIHLFQDHKGNARTPEEAIDTGISGVIADIPPNLYGNVHPIKVLFSYDASGLAKLKAWLPGLDREMNIAYNPSAFRLDGKEAEAREQVRELWRQHARASDYSSVIAKAERLMATIPAEERSPLSRMVLELKDALTTNNSEAIENAGRKLIDMLYEVEDRS